MSPPLTAPFGRHTGRSPVLQAQSCGPAACHATSLAIRLAPFAQRWASQGPPAPPRLRGRGLRRSRLDCAFAEANRPPQRCTPLPQSSWLPRPPSSLRASVACSRTVPSPASREPGLGLRPAESSCGQRRPGLACSAVRGGRGPATKARGGEDGRSPGRGGRVQELYGEASLGGEDEDEGEGEDDEAYAQLGHGGEDQEEAEEGEEEEEDDDAGILGRSVVQIRTVHRVPNFSRPWEEGHESESTSSAFVVALEPEVEPGAPGEGQLRRRLLLLMTTAGAVEHARKVEVSRSADDAQPFPASVAAVCLDLDVALLRVDDPAFWGQGQGADGEEEEEEQEEEGEEEEGEEAGRAAGLGRRRSGGRGKGRRSGRGGGGGGGGRSVGPSLVPLRLDTDLPYLRKPIVAVGFPLGGGSLCVTSGVVSRIEVVETSHSGRALLALQVDAPLNNGGWGGPALCASTGRCVGMAFQKFTSQTWMERYDETVADMFAGGSDDEDDGGGGGDPEGDDGGGGGPGQGYDEDAENIGYLVPSQLLGLVLRDYGRELSHQAASTSSSTAPAAATSTHGAGARRGGASRGARAGRTTGAAAAAAGAAEAQTSPLYLDGRPRLGLRYQRMESPALRRAMGLRAGQSGVLVTGVDPTGSAAGVLQVHDVLLAVAGRQVADDGTTLLRPGQRVLFGHWAAVGDVGGQLPLTVLRDGAVLELTIRLRDAGAPFLPVSLGPGRRPQYLVVGPLVFVAFSLPYWYELMSGQHQAAAMRNAEARRRMQSGLVPVLGALEWGMPLEDNGEEVVLLSEVLECGSEADSTDDDAANDTPTQAADPGPLGTSDPGGSGSSDAEVSGPGSAAEPPVRRPGVGSEAAAWAEQLGGAPRRLATVNGCRVRNLAHLAAVVMEASGAASTSGAGAGGALTPGQPFLRLGLEPAVGGSAGSAAAAGAAAPAVGDPPGDTRCGTGGAGSGPASCGGQVVVLDAESLAEDTRAVLQHHSVAAAMSAELRRRLSTSWPFEGGDQAHGGSRRRRQQGRRFAGSGRR